MHEIYINALDLPFIYWRHLGNSLIYLYQLLNCKSRHSYVMYALPFFFFYILIKLKFKIYVHVHNALDCSGITHLDLCWYFHICFLLLLMRGALLIMFCAPVANSCEHPSNAFFVLFFSLYFLHKYIRLFVLRLII